MASQHLTTPTRTYMTTRYAQLERLLELADTRLLKSICGTVIGNTALLSAEPSLAVRRVRLRDELHRTGLVEAALNYLVVSPERELIPLSEWCLSDLVGESPAILDHKHFERARSALRTREKARRTCIILPCHRLKPYNFSPTVIAAKNLVDLERLNDQVSIFVLSIPGFVPLEYAPYYPFAYYDWDRRRESKADFESLVARLYSYALDFFHRHRHVCTHFLAYFRPSAPHLGAMWRAADALNVHLTQVPTQPVVNRVIRRSGRAGWRFHGLKHPECLRALKRELLMDLASGRK